MDHQLQIVGFTPAATRIINLVASDVGRPVGQIVSNLVGYDSLVDDVRGCASCRGVGSHGPVANTLFSHVSCGPAGLRFRRGRHDLFDSERSDG